MALARPQISGLKWVWVFLADLPTLVSYGYFLTLDQTPSEDQYRTSCMPGFRPIESRLLQGRFHAARISFTADAPAPPSEPVGIRLMPELLPSGSSAKRKWGNGSNVAKPSQPTAMRSVARSHTGAGDLDSRWLMGGKLDAGFVGPRIVR
jgi:hypothetical protein